MFEYHWTWRGTGLTPAGLRSLWICRHGIQIHETAGSAPPGDDKKCTCYGRPLPTRITPIRDDYGEWISYYPED